MQTLRKKTSPLKYKNETSRFLGEGVSFKAKLIGILEVSEARGDRMCQEALSDLKTAIRAAGEHKQRITINIAIDGLRLRDEKTGDSLYHHPVHKISFIAQDMTDSRAFGYIFGSPDTGHRFFGIKTDKAASQVNTIQTMIILCHVVIAMRDLFQVVFALKKKEIELAKQHLDKNRYGTSPLFSETSISSSKSHSTPLDSNKTSTETKTNLSSTERPTPAVADLVDLELELNSLQQGLNQMERITPSDPFGSKDDPFGDSFTPFPQKPILPPPPSSGKDRASRSSESSSLFSPKTPHTTEAAQADTSKELNYSNEFATSHEEPTSGDWFTPSTSLFEDPPLVPEPIQDQHEVTKKEILSQFDVFTDLDPLGTGKFKPYVDKKHFFQELKNPPKKVLNDLVLESQPQESLTFPTNFETKKQNNLSTSPNLFPSDPFGEDPFVKTDPFAEADFTKQDPFETDGIFNKDARNDFSEQFKFPVKADLQTIFNSGNSLAKSPKSSMLEKVGTLPRSLQFSKQNTFDVHFDDKKFGVMQLHENPSLDLSSESECAPEPPPRPTNNLAQIKPPPLPPKKHPSEICVKPPPRPPHAEDVHYDFMDNYETASNSLEYNRSLEKSPPLPVPARKSKFESDFLPERPKKQFNVPTDEEDYLTPVSFPKPKGGEWQEPKGGVGQILLPPPQKVNRKSTSPNLSQVTVASYLESKPNITTSISSDKNSLDGLNITLSQLTLSGLNQLASKLNIPAGQLSNMTLVQLTNYLSNFIKSNAARDTQTETEAEAPFQADFANFNNFNKTSETYDRYAVFRELLQEEIKQTKIDSEPREITEEKESVEQQKINNNVNQDEEGVVIDKYAALREIVEIEVKQNDKDKSIEENDKNEEEEEQEEEEEITDQNNLDEQIENEANIINTEKFIDKDKSKDKVIEYGDVKVNKIIKSPVPVAVTEIVQNNTRLTSGSLSDVISGSSPEIDNTGSASEVAKKDNDTAGESWAIFDQPNLAEAKEKQNVQSEEGVSPWSSDSKEFGNGSPPDWRPRVDSGSGEEQWSRRRRDQEGWWDTSAEPEVQYYPPNRRSADSYEDECYACYERPRRRRQQGHWSSHVGQVVGGGGHSSSSRDVSPWEEEPSRRRDMRDHSKQMWSSRHGRQHSFERHKDRRHTDSWDEEDDFEYEEEHPSRFHWQDRHGSREAEREERWADDWGDDRKHRRRRGEVDRDRWCCPDWDQGETDKHPSRYSSGRWSDVPPIKWRDRKHDDRFYSRDSQDSPWEDEYPNEPEDTHMPHYLTAKRNWKRPSSASEMERKSGEMKPPRQYTLGTGGSDGERDRRYKSNRRSKSRESQFDNRHKPDPGLTLRTRPKQHHHAKGGHCEGDSSSKKIESTKLELSNKKASTASSRSKKSKESPKSEDVRKGPQSLFENDFVVLETTTCVNQSFTFENDFETSEAESPTIINKAKNVRQKIYASKDPRLGGLTKSYDSEVRVVKPSFKELKSARYQAKQKSLFEDDFSPTDKSEMQEPTGISSIKEEVNLNEDDTNNFSQSNGSRKKILMKNRLSNNLRADVNLKKSESVNIFAREDDPFDDDFFSGKDTGGNVNLVTRGKVSPKTTELKWTEQFEDFDTPERK